MIEFILYVLITSGWIWGFHCLFQEDHIFEFVADWWYKDDEEKNYSPEPSELELKVREYIAKPIFGCAACMASIHGTISYFLFVYRDFGFWLWPVFCIVLCGLNFVIIKLTTKERIIVEE
jgi:hypothetical protein